MAYKFNMQNPVEDYFKQDANKMKCLSVKTLSKRLNIGKKDVYFYIFNCSKLQRVTPLEVGSLANSTRVFKYCDL